MTAEKEKTTHGRLFLPALGMAVFSAWLVTVTFELLLINIAQSFHVQVGTAGLVAAVGSVSGIAAGLLLSVISVRINHKLLLMIGLACTSLAAVGFFLASTFGLLLVTNVAVGAGIAFATSMAYSLIGDFYPLEKRGRAIGWIVASTAMAYIIGTPIIGLIAGISSWRTVMILFALPVPLASLVLAFLAVPRKSTQDLAVVRREPFLEGCKQAVMNRSAVAALFVTMFSMAEGSISFYAISYFRSQFAITIAVSSVVMLVGNVLSAGGGVVAGIFVNRIGRKTLGTFTCLFAALLTLSFTFMPTFNLSWGLTALRFWFAGMSFTAGGSLVIEQLPRFRGTMMSLNTTFMNLGMLLASFAAAFALDLYNYQTLALILGGLGVVGTIIWVLLVRDPCKLPKQT
jgi:MFS transporter, DHA1 family, inner membrane transport protein